MKTTSVMSAALAVAVSACVGGSSSGSTASALKLVEVQAPGARFSVKATVQLQAYGLFGNGAKAKLSSTVRWASSDPSIIEVDQAGLAHLVAPGSARITAELEGQQGGTTIEVAAARARALELFPSDLFEAPRGLSPRLRLFATFTDGTRRDVSDEAAWSAGGAGAALLSDPGHFRLETQGDVALVARFDGLEASKRVRVLPPAIVSLTMAPMSAPLRPGQAMPLSTVATFTDGSSRDVTLEASVLSLDAHIARVSSREVVALAPGRARIVASYEGRSISRAVVVTARELVALTGSIPHADVPAGRTFRFRVYAAFDDGSALDVSEVAQWLSADEQVASVALDGTVTGAQQGLSQLVARYGGRQVDFTVGVQAPVLEGLEVTLARPRLLVGQRASFAVFGRFSDGAVLNLTPVAVLRASPLVSLSRSADLAVIEALADGPASIEVEASGYLRSLQLEVSDASLVRLAVVQPTREVGTPERSLRVWATYGDDEVLDVTELCDFRSSSAGLIVSNTPGARGTYSHAGGEALAIASMHGQSATFTFGP